MLDQIRDEAKSPPTKKDDDVCLFFFFFFFSPSSKLCLPAWAVTLALCISGPAIPALGHVRVLTRSLARSLLFRPSDGAKS